MATNVKITSGAEDFQIYQHENNKANITVSGTYTISEDNNKVWLRIVSEDYNLPVINWTKAKLIDEKNFEITFVDVPSGGLYRIESGIMNNINQSSWVGIGDTVFHIGVGDLFVISGQSNSTGYSRTPIADKMEMGVHLYRNSQKWDIASHPMGDSTNTKHDINMEGSNPGQCPYLAFGKKMKSFLGYPIGLIQTSLGGSPLSRWNIAEEGDLYRNMLQIISDCTGKKMKVAGVLWYQGCSDANNAASDTYFERFENMVAKTRKDLKNKNLPFYTIQLNKLVSEKTKKLNYNWGTVREAQRMAHIKITSVYLVPSVDLGMSDAIHNGSSANIVLGERLANLALSEVYKKLPSAKAPNLIKAVKTGDSSIKFVFENVIGYINDLGMPKEFSQFEIFIENEKANVTYFVSSNNEINIRIDKEIKDDIKISYCNEAFVHQIVPYDIGTGLPVIPFSIDKLSEQAL